MVWIVMLLWQLSQHHTFRFVLRMRYHWDIVKTCGSSTWYWGKFWLAKYSSRCLLIIYHNKWLLSSLSKLFSFSRLDATHVSFWFLSPNFVWIFSEPFLDWYYCCLAVKVASVLTDFVTLWFGILPQSVILNSLDRREKLKRKQWLFSYSHLFCFRNISCIKNL